MWHGVMGSGSALSGRHPLLGYAFCFARVSPFSVAPCLIRVISSLVQVYPMQVTRKRGRGRTRGRRRADENADKDDNEEEDGGADEDEDTEQVTARLASPLHARPDNWHLVADIQYSAFVVSCSIVPRHYTARCAPPTAHCPLHLTNDARRATYDARCAPYRRRHSEHRLGSRHSEHRTPKSNATHRASGTRRHTPSA